MTLAADELYAQVQRRALIREALVTGSAVMMRLHAHLHAPGYAVYAEHGTARIYACTLVSEILPVIFDGDLVVMADATDPEETVRAWLLREFAGISIEHVRIERYVEPIARARAARKGLP